MTSSTLHAGAVFATVLVPLLAAAACALPLTRRFAPAFVSVAAMPAFAFGVFAPDGFAEFAWLGTGAHISLDPTARAFLLLAAGIWTAAGLYALATVHTARPRFFGFFALAMAGNLGLVLAVDPATFYTFFSMMALSTYALVAHGDADGPIDAADPGPRRAGRVYMAFTVIGEAMLLSGFFVLVVGGVSLVPLATALVLLAFGIKIGAPGVHGWMPIAYSAAPPAAAAALAGSMSTAGVVGILRFVPGAGDMPAGMGVTVMVFGLVAAFGGALVGVVQRTPAVVLAYSSVSQFGLMTVAIGAGLTSPKVWPVAVVAATVYAVHHGIAKAALFLGGDVAIHSARRGPALVALALPALALAGLPLTSGAIAKIVLKEATGAAPAGWNTALEVLLPLAAVGTTVLVARYCYLVWRAAAPQPEPRRRQALAAAVWGAALVAVAAVVWLWSDEAVQYAASTSLTATYLWLSTWPVLLGLTLAAITWAARSLTVRLAGVIPPGDLYAPVFSVAHELVEARDTMVAGRPAPTSSAEKPAPSIFARTLEAAGRIESGLLVWASAMTAAGTLTVIVLILALTAGR